MLKIQNFNLFVTEQFCLCSEILKFLKTDLVMAKPATNEGQKNDSSAKSAINGSNDKHIESMFEKYKERVSKFEDIVCDLPVDNNRIISDKWKEYRQEAYDHMQKCYPLVHGSVISLAYNFLLIKVN